MYALRFDFVHPSYQPRVRGTLKLMYLFYLTIDLIGTSTNVSVSQYIIKKHIQIRLTIVEIKCKIYDFILN